MAIKKISEFTSGTPTASDKILFEQDGAGKSTTIKDAVNTCSLTYEEIMASTDLSGKVASAESLKTYKNNMDDRLQRIYSVPYISSSVLGTTDDESYFKAWVNYIFNNYKYVLGKTIVAMVNPSSDGVCIGLIYDDTRLSYATFMFIPIASSATLFRFGYINGTWNYSINS